MRDRHYPRTVMSELAERLGIYHVDADTPVSRRPVRGGRAHARKGRRRRDWRRGGRSVRRWGTPVLAAAFLCAGFGIVGAALLSRLEPTGAGPLSTLAFEGALLIAVIFALVRARPSGLFTFRTSDVVWGLAAGLSLRLLQGVLSNANQSSFPTGATPDGYLAVPLMGVLTLGVITPMVEELFFRGVLLVSVFRVLKDGLGDLAAATTATLLSAGVFVLVHAVDGTLSLSSGLQLLIFGTSCAVAVFLTGRVWTAAVIHIVYNSSYLLLAALGDALS